MTAIITKDGKLKIDSSIENKTARGCREALSCGVVAPSDGMIELRFGVGENEYIQLWMSCERARNFCDMLNDNLLLHEELGVRNTYPPRRIA